jgi:hypothetical protein
LVAILPVVGQAEEALAITDESLAAAEALGNPYWIAFSMCACERALSTKDPLRALHVAHQGIAFSRRHRLPYWEAMIALDAAALEVFHGNPGRAPDLFDVAIDLFHRAGNLSDLALVLGTLTKVFDQLGLPEVAATVYGTTERQAMAMAVIELGPVLDHLRLSLGAERYEQCVATGAAMVVAEAVNYARTHVRLVLVDAVGSVAPWQRVDRDEQGGTVAPGAAHER